MCNCRLFHNCTEVHWGLIMSVKQDQSCSILKPGHAFYPSERFTALHLFRKIHFCIETLKVLTTNIWTINGKGKKNCSTTFIEPIMGQLVNEKLLIICTDLKNNA